MLIDIRIGDNHPREILQRDRALAEPSLAAVDPETASRRGSEDSRSAAVARIESALGIGPR